MIQSFREKAGYVFCEIETKLQFENEIVTEFSIKLDTEKKLEKLLCIGSKGVDIQKTFVEDKQLKFSVIRPCDYFGSPLPTQGYGHCTMSVPKANRQLTHVKISCIFLVD